MKPIQLNLAPLAEPTVSEDLSSVADGQEDMLAASRRMFDLLKKAGEQDIQHLEPADATQPDGSALLAALDKFAAALQAEALLLVRLEKAVRRLEQLHQQAHGEVPTSETVYNAPQHDAGDVWSRGLTDRARGTR